MSTASQAEARRGAPPPAMDPMLPEIARVRGRRQEGPGIVTLDIALETGHPWPPVVPGQFNMLGLFGVGEIPISVSGRPADTGVLRHTVRAAGAVSGALGRLEPGDALTVRGPFGVGWPMAEIAGRDVVVIAGGLGLAPVRPVVEAILADRGHHGRAVLLHGARSPEGVLFPAEHEDWRQNGIEVEVTVDHADAAWTGRVGVVTTLIARAALDPARTVALVCGPEVMMRAVAAALRDVGIPDAAIFLSLERNMKCAVGLCGHCQFGPTFVCRDGPVLACDRIGRLLGLREI